MLNTVIFCHAHSFILFLPKIHVYAFDYITMIVLIITYDTGADLGGGAVQSHNDKGGGGDFFQ